MKAFVTGGTGLLGSNLVKQLTEQGHEVKALARSTEKAERVLDGLNNVTIVQGDMEHIDSFAHELSGCDVLFHTAAYFREYYDVGDHWATLERINVIGTIDLLTSAEKHGVQKAVHTSSSGVIGKTKDGNNPDETTPTDSYVMNNLYFKSKVLAEEKIHVWQRNHTMPVYFVNPTAMYGPGDAAPTGAGQLLIDFVHGELPAIPPGGFNVVDVRDVAQAMITVLDKGEVGERYALNNRYYSLKDVLTIVANVTGKTAPKMVLPYPIALTYSYVSEAIARLTNSSADVPVSAIKTLNNTQTLSNAKAKRVLHFQPRSFEQTIYDEIQWFLENDYIKHQLSLKPIAQIS